MAIYKPVGDYGICGGRLAWSSLRLFPEDCRSPGAGVALPTRAGLRGLPTTLAISRHRFSDDALSSMKRSASSPRALSSSRSSPFK